MDPLLDDDRLDEPVYSLTITRGIIRAWIMSHNLPGSDANIDKAVEEISQSCGFGEYAIEGIRTAFDRWVSFRELEHFETTTAEDTYTDPSIDFNAGEYGRASGR